MFDVQEKELTVSLAHNTKTLRPPPPQNDMFAAATAAASVYLLLTIAALLSTISPELTALSSHGKTRTSYRECTKTHDAADGMLRRLWQYLINSNRFTMHKRRFIDFYATGIIVTSTLVLLHHATIASDPHAKQIDRRADYILTNKYEWMPTCLLLTHLIRRYFECNWVQKSNTSSRMHFAGYLVGFLHYLCLPFILAPYPFYHSTCDDDDNPFPGACSDGIQNAPNKKMIDVFAIIGCIYFQYEQHRHHFILARLRNNEPASATYSIPDSGWFKQVSCPHYLSEVMIYLMFALIMHNESHTPVQSDARAWEKYLPDLSPGTATLATIYRLKHWILLVWVIVNLSISASRSHDWYHENFGETYPQQRKRLIPFIW